MSQCECHERFTCGHCLQRAAERNAAEAAASPHTRGRQDELRRSRARFHRACEREDARLDREAAAGLAMYQCDRCGISVGQYGGGACVRPASRGRKCQGRMRLQ